MQTSQTNWTNAVVVVTGANRGLGRALIDAALAAGARKVYAGARDPSQLAAAAKTAPGKIIPLALDVTSPASLAAAAAAAPDATVLINNAGVLASYNVLAATPEQIAQDFATNAFGLLAASKAFLPALERAPAGTAALVNVLSVLSFANIAGLGGYGAAKSAAFSITQALRSELAAKRIAVHAVFPGPIDTDMIRSFELTKTSPEVVAKNIVDGVARGIEDILPDPTSQDYHATWSADPKALERRFAAM